MTLHLIIGNKNYSSWSFRPWIAMKAAGIPFDEEVLPIETPEFRARLDAVSGTGKVPTMDEIAEMHSALRRRLTAAYGETGERMAILYGGSVKAANAAEIFAVPDVDGALVGGASLTAADFIPIVAAAAVEGSGGIA